MNDNKRETGKSLLPSLTILCNGEALRTKPIINNLPAFVPPSEEAPALGVISDADYERIMALDYRL